MNIAMLQTRKHSRFWSIISSVIELLILARETVRSKLTRKSRGDEPFPNEAPH
jgi:hypothetical protein